MAYKLDIDTPFVEIPIAVDLLLNASSREHVHEFFFEFHFRCEVMQGFWGYDKIPVEYNGLKTNRYSALTFFQNLRKAGVRAHFWP